MSGEATQVNLDVYRRPGGFDGGKTGTFCGAPHPNNPPPETPGDVDFYFCRRLKKHRGKHAAFTFLISTPEEW